MYINKTLRLQGDFDFLFLQWKCTWECTGQLYLEKYEEMKMLLCTVLCSNLECNFNCHLYCNEPDISARGLAIDGLKPLISSSFTFL